MSASVAKNDNPLAFSGFLEYLRSEGFTIGIDDHLRLQKLIKKLDDNCSPYDLKTILCPIFATSKFQQEKFNNAFDLYFDLFKPPVATENSKSENENKSISKKNQKPAASNNLRTILIGVSAILTWEMILLTLALYFGIMNAPTSPNGNNTIQPKTSPYLIPTLLLILSPLFYLAYKWYKSRSHKLVLQKRLGKKPPYNWLIRIDKPAAAIHNSEEFFAVARIIHRREFGDFHRLDIPTTISATIEAADYPCLRYKLDSKPPEYLILIERASYRDHQAEFFNLLVKRLQQEGAFVMQYFYQYDPRICYTEIGQAGITLTRLQERFPDHRLIIFSTGGKMVNPITGSLKPWISIFSKWRYRVLISNEARARWGLREKLLARHFLILPANLNSLLALADYFERGMEPELKSWTQGDSEIPPREFDQPEIVEALRRYLGDECFRWLCACAVYSELQWDLTLHLGSLPIIGKNLLTEANLLKMIQLPWFRDGYIPNEQRTLLINQLDRKKVEAVRSAIIELLKNSPLPEDSYAASINQLDLAIQQQLLQDHSPGYTEKHSRQSNSKAQGAYTALSMLIKPFKPALDIALPGSLRKPLSPLAISETKPKADVKPHHSLEKHPKGLYVLFAAEMWERFSFYSMLALFTLYMRNPDEGFGWSVEQSITLYSNYLMFVYASPLIGGWLADKKLGYRRAVMIGGVFFMAGHLLLSFRSLTAVYAALTCLVIGNGLFKPNVSTMVGNLYPEGSHLKDRAYNVFYMGINVGAGTAPVVMEIIKQNFGNHPAFAIAAFGMLISVGILWKFKNHVGSHKRVASLAPAIAGAAAVKVKDLVKPVPGQYNKIEFSHDSHTAKATPMEMVPESRRIAALIVIFLIVIVFWMVFHQNGSTLTYWADRNTYWNVTGTLSNAINPLWVVTLTFPLVWFWKWLDSKGKEPSTPTKMAIGMTLTGLSFFILYFAAKTGEATVTGSDPYAFKVSPMWLIISYAVVTLGELMLSPMGLALVSKVAPIRMRGLMMGGWFVATAIGNKLTMIGVYWDKWLHSTFFAILGAAALFMAVVLFLLLKPLKKAMPGV